MSIPDTESELRRMVVQMGEPMIIQYRDGYPPEYATRFVTPQQVVVPHSDNTDDEGSTDDNSVNS
jgi:hypothetical protein